MSKARLKTMAAIAAVAALMLPSVSRIAMAQGAAPSAAAAPAMEEPGTRSFKLVSVEVDGAKIWLPSVIAVEQGDKVKLTLENLVPGASNQHGFTIPAYNITEVVTRGEPKTVTFVADKPGVYQYFCQLHPAHIGGSLIVEPGK
ncbi:MAG: cupredoxin domain-containing protein [Candidatus Binatus sp.]